MKAKWFLLAGLSTMMLGACSDDNLATQTEDKPTIEGKAYMDLKLNFPGAEGSRAADDQGFENGDEDESRVSTVTVYYFRTDQENSYINKGTASRFTLGPSGNDDNIEGTVTAQVPADVVSYLTGEQKANIIVVLNEPEDLSTNVTNYSTFNKALATNDGAILNSNQKKSFMMSSVNYYPEDPTSDLDPKGHKITYFTEISKNDVYKDNDAVKNPVEVWVERVCGKVELKQEATLSKNATVRILGWNLNVRNKTVYPVKVLDNSFTSLTTTVWPGADDWTHEDAEKRYRSYWAKDTNYDGTDYTAGSSTDFTLIQAKDINKSLSTPLYCLENTFNHNQQNRDETTTAVVLAQYLPDNLNTETDKTWLVMDGLSYDLKTFVSNYLKGQNAWKKISDEGKTKYATLDYDDVTFAYETNSMTIDEESINISIKSVSITAKEGTKIYRKTDDQPALFEEFTTAEWESLTNNLQTLLSDKDKVKVYVDGHCYYEIPIRHFKDNEVPLAGTEGAINSTINDQSQLGRYGIVRNHWYQLKITGVSKPGKPLPGDTETITPDPDPDDPTESNYISVKINVLSWAVRTQDVEL